MRQTNRRSAMRVRDGRVLPKNITRSSAHVRRALRPHEIRLERRRPNELNRHLISIADLRAFLPLLPDWEEVAVGLEAIILDGDGTERAAERVGRVRRVHRGPARPAG
jgi:hypothetical protein